jgi:hypothetical protein
MKTKTLLLVALLATGFLPLANAGSQAAPEVTDAADDAAVDGSPLQAILDLIPENSDDFGDVEIISAWINETDSDNFFVVIESAGDVQADTATTLTYSIDAGSSSEFGSTANGTVVTIELTGDAIASGAPANTTASMSGAELTISFSRVDAGVAGGDVFRNFTVDRSRSADGLAPPASPGQDATDSAGPGLDYNFSRIPIVGDAIVGVTGGEIGGVAFNASNEAHLHDEMTGFFTLQVTNSGTDVDSYSVQVEVNGTATATATPMAFSLNPGANTMVQLDFDATGADAGSELTTHLTSTNGADVETVLSLEVEGHDGGSDDKGDGNGTDGDSSDREPVFSFLSPLTPAAEAIAFDDIFDDYAELVLLLLMILLLVFIILLLVLLLRRGWLAGAADPKTITATSGEDVEFGITVQNRKKFSHGVNATFVSEGATAGLTMTPEDGVPMDALTAEGDASSFELTGKGELGDFAEGALRVQAPSEAGKHRVDVLFTPLDEDGAPHTKKAARVRATIKVVDDMAGDVPALSLGAIEHSPAHPVEGDNVLTTTTVHNNSDDNAELRVVLLVDNEPVQQETIRVQSGSSAGIEFPWTAARGKNKVRVQVFEA